MKGVYYGYFFGLLLICFVSGARAQKTEFGLLAGGSYYYGDIVNDFQAGTIKGSCGLFIRQRLSENVAIKVFGGYCRVGGADSNSVESSFQRNRNLSFWSDIFEGSVQFEINLVRDIVRGRRLRHRFVPYIFAGIGGFYFLSYTDNPYNPRLATKLKNLHTEGKSYDPYAVCIPFGLGFRVKLSSNINLGLEFGPRWTSTSYIDDVGGVEATYPDPSALPSHKAYLLYDRSKLPKNPDVGYGYGYPGKQRGKMTVNDFYFIYGITLGYRIEYVNMGMYHGKHVRRLRFQ